MRRALTAITIAACFAISAAAQTGTWQIDPNHSNPQFSVRHLGISTVRGSFSKVNGTVQYDPADLSKTGLPPESVETKATLTFEPKDGKPTITKIHLECVGRVPNATAEGFAKAAEGAKANCPISRVLNTEITLGARLA